MVSYNVHSYLHILSVIFDQILWLRGKWQIVFTVHIIFSWFIKIVHQKFSVTPLMMFSLQIWYLIYIYTKRLIGLNNDFWISNNDWYIEWDMDQTYTNDTPWLQRTWLSNCWHGLRQLAQNLQFPRCGFHCSCHAGFCPWLRSHRIHRAWIVNFDCGGTAVSIVQPAGVNS